MPNLSQFITEKFLGLMGGDPAYQLELTNAIDNGNNSLNNILAGTNISLSLSNGQLTINASGGGGGVTSLNTLTGGLTIVAGSGISVTPSGSNITIASTVSSGANTTLSNLTSPTSINQSLVPSTDATFNLGSSGNTWQSGYFSGFVLSGELFNITNQWVFNGFGVHTSPDGGQAAGLYNLNGPNNGGEEDWTIATKNGNSATFNTGNIYLETGNNSSTGPSGSINLIPGTVAGGTQGSINLYSSTIIGASSTTPTHSLNTSTSTPANGALTLTNAPTGISGDPTGYISININGSPHVIPFW